MDNGQKVSSIFVRIEKRWKLYYYRFSIIYTNSQRMNSITNLLAIMNSNLFGGKVYTVFVKPKWQTGSASMI